MKHLLLILAIATVMVSCKSKAKEDTQVLSATQLADYTEFLKWKESQTDAPVANHKTVTRVVYKTAPAYATTAPVVAKKKGWSKAAKGAVIGGATGAVAGAILVKKNRAAGAAVGAAVGAGVGYGIGRSKDKKDGRY